MVRSVLSPRMVFEYLVTSNVLEGQLAARSVQELFGALLA